MLDISSVSPVPTGLQHTKWARWREGQRQLDICLFISSSCLAKDFKRQITNFWISGFLEFWISGFLDFWISGFLDFWISGFLDFWISGFLDF